MDDTYAYDAAGNRMTRTESGETVAYTLGTGDRLASWTGGAYAYDDSWQVIADLDEQGSVVVSYVWGYVDSQNNVVARWRYDAWGNVIAEDVSVPALARIRYRFQGREWSVATGLTNFRMRWYDPETGRWLSKAPIGLSGGLNLYAFCENNVINMIDFDGRMSWSEASEIAGAAAEGFAEGFAKGLAATVDGFLPFGDPLADIYGDECGNIDGSEYQVSYYCGIVSFEALTSAVGLKGGQFLRAGKEIKVGKNLRIAPNGNRTGNVLGERPHYHRRGINRDGTTRPGQGIGRHRPWETKSSDTSFWDRF